MSSILLTAPATEPLSLAEAKAYLRVETGDDDAVIGALIAGSRIHVEAQTRRALITQSWRISVDAWPDDGRLMILPAPLQALTAARVYDFDNAAYALDTAAFVLDRGAFHAGDVLLFRWRAKLPAKHAAIVTAADTMVHAHDGAAVAEVTIAPWWRRRLAYAFRFPGVDLG
jgi:uncharacterized phiE125 gp8 family phage protein